MAWNLCFLSVIVISTSVHVGIHAATDCYWRSRLYSGYRQTTENGTLCQRWDAYKRDYIVPKNFPDATVSDAANFCRDPDRSGNPWCFFKGKSWMFCGIAKCDNYNIIHCGSLKIEQPTILGRDVTFSFTPNTIDPHEFNGWQRTNKVNPWAPLPVGDKFIQYKQNGSYYLTVTNTVNDHTGTDAVFYRILYFNQTVKCIMETEQLNLLDISRHPCGYVYLRTDKVREDENVEIEYYPSRNVMRNPQNFERQWTRSNTTFIPIRLKRYLYEEEKGMNDKYVLTIFLFNHRMEDLYGVNCGGGAGYTNFVSVIIPVPPSPPVLNGSQAIEECENCIVGQDRDKFRVLCKTTGGTEPVDVTITVGNEPQTKVPYPEEDGYIAFFYLHERHHMAVVTCTVSNAALTSPLNVSSHIYVIKSPVFQSFNVPDVLREGDTVNISCTLYGGRPAPKVILNISDVDVTSFDHMDYYVDEKSFVNITAVSLTTFKREWNGKNITCCRYNEWYNMKDECSPPKQINYLFPPSRIDLDIKVEEEPMHKVYAVCTIYNSNPACIAKFSAPHGVIDSERYTKNVSQQNGAWDSVYAINLNVSEDSEGEEMHCEADCEGLTVDLRDTSSIVLPYAPEIDFNISGQVLNITKGEQEYVTCSAKSFPPSNISWVELTYDEGKKTWKECQSSTDCVLTIDGHLISQRRFICMARYFETTEQNNLTVNVFEKVKQQFMDQEKNDSAEKSFIWVTLGCCLAVLVAVVTVFFIVIRRKKKAKQEANQLRVNATDNGASSSRCEEDQLGDHEYGNLNSTMHACDDPELVYSQPDKNKAAFSDTDPVQRSYQPGSSSNENQHMECGQLFYADLDFDPTATPAKDAKAKRRATPTEYVAIDFVKTAAEQSKENEQVEAENIYANQ